jgi:hypothetical protein
MNKSEVINERCGSLILDDIDTSPSINLDKINIDVINNSLQTIIQQPLLETPILEAPIPEAPILEAPILEAPIPEAPLVETPIPEAPLVETPILEAPILEAPILEAPILEAPIPEAPLVETPILEAPILEAPVVETITTAIESVLEANNEIDEIKKQLEILRESKSESSSNQETLGDSVIESISNSVISNSLPITKLTNLENNIANIIESCLTDNNNTMENIDYTNKVITETNLNYENRVNIENNELEIFKIPEPEIVELDKITQNDMHPLRYMENDLMHKSTVTFSSTDLQDLISFGSINANNNLGNNSSLNTNSEFSYTKKIKDTKQPNLASKPLYRDIRLSNSNSNSNNFKKKQKKQIELDEVDYLYNKLQDYSRYLTINITNYMMIITKAMEIIENYEDFAPSSGYGKKDVVIKAINRLVMIDLELGESDKRVFLSTLSNFIELIIMCSKRHLKDSNRTTKDNFNIKNDKIEDMILASCGQIVFSLIDKLTTIILKNQYNAEKITHNIPTITEILMLMSDKYDYLTGFEKKNIVLQAMNVFIRDKLEHIIDLEQDKKKEIIEILQCVPNTIDLFIALQKQKYKINKKSIIKVKKSGCLAGIFATKKSYEDD